MTVPNNGFGGENADEIRSSFGDRMNGILWTLCIGPALLLLIGCGKTRTDVAAPNKPISQLQEPPGQRVGDLQQRVDQLRRTVSQMPANNPTEDRRLTAQALGQLASALALIEGPRMTGDFRQRLRVIESSRTQIQSAGGNVPIEPPTDSALRATYDVLMALSQGRFAGDQTISGTLNTMSQQIPQLDAVRGPLHSLVVAQTLENASRALKQMSTVLEQRLAAQPAPR
jgi:hypothetical protein